MSVRKLKSTYSSGTLVWILPQPIIPAIPLGSKSGRYTYTLRNNSDVPVTIESVDFVPGHEPRIRIVGGTCQRAAQISPHASASIILEVNPITPGVVQQTLRVQHRGFGPPLWVDIVFTVLDAPTRKRVTDSYLTDETWLMDRQRRLAEQEGHRRLAKVHAREHPAQDPSLNPVPEGELQNSILQNPWLDSQRFDGVDPNLNPEPPLNTEARREFDNARREQEMEKQLRLGNMPKFSPGVKPRPY